MRSVRRGGQRAWPRAALLPVQHTLACLELIGGDSDLGIELLSRSVEDASESTYDGRLVALVNLGSGAGEVRRYETAVDSLVAAEAFGVAHDLDASVAYARAWLARIAFEQGRWDDAVAYASLVDATTPNRDGYALLTARGVLGRVRVRRGDPGGAEMLRETLAGFKGHDLQYRWSPVAGMAEHHWLRGEQKAMVAVLSGPYEEALDTDSVWARGELGYWMWKAGELQGPPNRAAAPYMAQISGEAGRAARLWEEIGSPYEAALARSEGPSDAAIEALSTLDALGNAAGGSGPGRVAGGWCRKDPSRAQHDHAGSSVRPDRTSGRGVRADDRRTVEQRDRRALVRLEEDRRAPCVGRLRQARRGEPGSGDRCGPVTEAK